MYGLKSNILVEIIIYLKNGIPNKSIKLLSQNNILVIVFLIVHFFPVNEIYLRKYYYNILKKK